MNRKRLAAALIFAVLPVVSPAISYGQSILNQEYLSYLAKIAEAEGYEELVFWSPTIQLDSNITAEGIDLVLVAQSIDFADYSIKLTPPPPNEDQLDGMHGRSVYVLAEKITQLNFVLPGGEGNDGSIGRPGNNGRSQDARQSIDGGSYGTPGGTGERGGNGGHGGDLSIEYVNGEAPRVRLVADGGPPGVGGPGGPGGISYAYEITKIIRREGGPGRAEGGLGGAGRGVGGQVTEQYIFGPEPKPSKNRDGQIGPDGTEGRDGQLQRRQISKDAFFQRATTTLEYPLNSVDSLTETKPFFFFR